jgi:hypothetical protein
VGDVSEYRGFDSRYAEFLFAEIGEQDNGMPMSMVSALTRLELDPWGEASRLAALPTAAAQAAVADLIGRTLGLDTPAAEIAKLSVRLVGLLAKGRSASSTGKLAIAKIGVRGWSWKPDARWLAAAFAIGLVIIASRLILIG